MNKYSIDTTKNTDWCAACLGRRPEGYYYKLKKNSTRSNFYCRKCWSFIVYLFWDLSRYSLLFIPDDAALSINYRNKWKLFRPFGSEDIKWK